MKISIIVPIYNCEKYLHKSIKSLINQSIFAELEIIFIDDGSTDEGAIIVKNYVDQYQNMRLIKQRNSGVSVARNRGISEAKGEYIAFFDADDVAEPCLYEILLEIIEKHNADMSIVDYSMVFNDGTKVKHRKNEYIVWQNQEELLIDFFKENRICSNPVDKLYTAKIAKSIEFPVDYAIGEDLFYVFRALQKSRKVVLDSGKSLYNYIIHDNSTMKGAFSKKNLDAVSLMKIIMQETKDNLHVYYYAEAKYYNEVCKALAILVKSDKSKYFVSERNELTNTLKKYKLSKAALYMSKKHFCALLIMRISPKLYNSIYEWLKIG